MRPRRRADRRPAPGEPAPRHGPRKRHVQGGPAVGPGAWRALGPSPRDAGRAQRGGGAARRRSRRRQRRGRRGAHTSDAPAPRRASVARGRSRADEDGTIAFVGATLRGNLRLLVGMVRANQPARVIARLSSALAVSLGTAAYAMSSSSIWMLSHGMAWPRLALFGAASIITLCVVLVLAHGLWERTSGLDDRQAVVLFNLTTSATLGLAVLTLYASLLARSVVGGAGLIPPTVLSRQRRAHAGGGRLSEARQEQQRRA
jgi:hypothetical protein